MKNFFLNRFVLTLMVLSPPALSFALSPLIQYQDLVAGSGEVGFEDGAFYSSEFNGPEGLTLNEDGSILYVADTMNHRIRAVDLNNQNLVKTIAGTGIAGNQNGLLATATFNQPVGLTFIPGGQIAVCDGGGSSIRLIDLNKGEVSTLCAADGLVWNTAYLPSDQHLYFTQPDQGTIQRIDLKGGKVETVLQKNVSLPHPGALCVCDSKLYVADYSLGSIFELDIAKTIPKPNADKTIPDLASLQPAGTAHDIIALAGYDKNLYAYQADVQQPLFRVFPNSQPITFTSVWGEDMATLPHFSGVTKADRVGFIADPRSDSRFFMSNPEQAFITSYRDLRMGGPEDGLTEDFTYPEKKPFRTFRIFLYGRSYLTYEMAPAFAKKPADYSRISLMHLMAKRLELTLNTLASLQDVPIHFEVLNGNGRPDGSIYLTGYYEIPDVVKKYDVDLVVLMMDPSGIDLSPYRHAPLTKEGIPERYPNPEFILKPDAEKYKSGIVRDFFDLCKKNNVFGISGGTWIVTDNKKVFLDPNLRSKLEDVIAKPIDLLKNKLISMKKDGEQPCRLCVCCFSTPATYHYDKASRNFWKELCRNEGISFTDIDDVWQAFRLTYFPCSDMLGNDHLTADGHLIYSFLLANQFIKDGIIPFQIPASR